MPNDGIRLKIILIIEVRKLEFTDFDSHSHDNSNIRHFQALFDIKYISYDFPQAEQRVIGEYAYNKKSRLILKLENYLRQQGDPGMGYGVIKNRAVAK